MRAVAGEIVVLTGVLLAIFATLLPVVYLTHNINTSVMPIAPELLLVVGIATMAAGAVAILPEVWDRKGK